LIEEVKKKLENLYWKIYSIGHIMNNELYLWMVKGWIVENKGNDVNWVEVATTPARKKT
jgi:hypothetical protein